MDGRIHISQTDLGIGDILCSLYALEAFSRAHGRPAITLHLRDHLAWMQAVAMPGLTVCKHEEAIEPRLRYRLGDSAEDYARKLRENHDPKIWYSRKLEGSAPQPPALNPQLDEGAPAFPQPYVLLAPFATRLNRTWEIHNWRLLAEGLKAGGYQVVALDAPDQPERCKLIGVDYFWGQQPLWTLRALRRAALVVSCDSGLAHVGGLLGVPTLVVMSQLTPGLYYSQTDNQFVVPQQACVNCRFQPERGYEERCDFGCWALQSISPRRVLEKALRMLDRGAAATAPPGPRRIVALRERRLSVVAPPPAEPESEPADKPETGL